MRVIKLLAYLALAIFLPLWLYEGSNYDMKEAIIQQRLDSTRQAHLNYMDSILVLSRTNPSLTINNVIPNIKTQPVPQNQELLIQNLQHINTYLDQQINLNQNLVSLLNKINSKTSSNFPNSISIEFTNHTPKDSMSLNLIPTQNSNAYDLFDDEPSGRWNVKNSTLYPHPTGDHDNPDKRLYLPIFNRTPYSAEIIGIYKQNQAPINLANAIIKPTKIGPYKNFFLVGEKLDTNSTYNIHGLFFIKKGKHPIRDFTIILSLEK